MSRINPAVILEAVRSHVIAGALQSINEHEGRAFRREGCLEGLRIAGALALHPECWDETLEDRHAFEHGLCRSGMRDREHVEAFFRYRCATAQIEYVRDRLRVLWAAHGLDTGRGPISVRASLDVYRWIATQPPELRRNRA